MYSDPSDEQRLNYRIQWSVVSKITNNDVIIVNNSELGHYNKFDILGVKNTENCRMNTMHMIVAMDIFK